MILLIKEVAVDEGRAAVAEGKEATAVEGEIAAAVEGEIAGAVVEGSERAAAAAERGEL